MRFATAIIERCKRRETSAEEAMIEMYLAGVSIRRVEDISGILWGSSVSAATFSIPNEKAFKAVEGWRSRPLTCDCSYVFVDGICLKRSWGGSFENVAVMVAMGGNDDGCREIRRRTRVVDTFPDRRSALMLVTARLKYVADSE